MATAPLTATLVAVTGDQRVTLLLVCGSERGAPAAAHGARGWERGEQGEQTAEGEGREARDLARTHGAPAIGENDGDADEDAAVSSIGEPRNHSHERSRDTR